MKTVMLPVVALLNICPNPSPSSGANGLDQTLLGRERIQSHESQTAPLLPKKASPAPIYGTLDGDSFACLDVSAMFQESCPPLEQILDWKPQKDQPLETRDPHPESWLSQFSRVALNIKPLEVQAAHQGAHTASTFAYQDVLAHKLHEALRQLVQKHVDLPDLQSEKAFLKASPGCVFHPSWANDLVFPMQQPGLLIFIPKPGSLPIDPKVLAPKVLVSIKNPHRVQGKKPNYRLHTECQLLSAQGLHPRPSPKSHHPSFTQPAGAALDTPKSSEHKKSPTKPSPIPAGGGLSAGFGSWMSAGGGQPEGQRGTLWVWTKDFPCLRPQDDNDESPCFLMYWHLAHRHPHVQFHVYCRNVTYFLEELFQSYLKTVSQAPFQASLKPPFQPTVRHVLTQDALRQWATLPPQHPEAAYRDLLAGLILPRHHSTGDPNISSQAPIVTPLATDPSCDLASALTQQVLWAQQIHVGTMLTSIGQTLQDLKTGFLRLDSALQDRFVSHLTGQLQDLRPLLKEFLGQDPLSQTFYDVNTHVNGDPVEKMLQLVTSTRQSFDPLLRKAQDQFFLLNLPGGQDPHPQRQTCQTQFCQNAPAHSKESHLTQPHHQTVAQDFFSQDDSSTQAMGPAMDPEESKTSLKTDQFMPHIFLKHWPRNLCFHLLPAQNLPQPPYAPKTLPLGIAIEENIKI